MTVYLCLRLRCLIRGRCPNVLIRFDSIQQQISNQSNRNQTLDPSAGDCETAGLAGPLKRALRRHEVDLRLDLALIAPLRTLMAVSSCTFSLFSLHEKGSWSYAAFMGLWLSCSCDEIRLVGQPCGMLLPPEPSTPRSGPPPFSLAVNALRDYGL